MEVELGDTAGAIDNLRLLEDGVIDVALVQAGLSGAGERERLPVRDFADLRDLRVSFGAEGSGTRALLMRLQSTFGGLSLSTRQAEAAFLAGEIDAAVFAASPDAFYIQSLMRAEGVRPLAFKQAEAITRRNEGLSSVILLRAVVGIGADIPERDVPLLAAVAQLAVRKDIHPAIEALLLDSAVTIHSGQSLFSPAGRFPIAENADLPVSRQVLGYYRDGPSFLRRYFSFGVANFLERAWVLAIPLLTLAFPLGRAAPPIYRWRVRCKIYFCYKDLRQLDEKGRALPPGVSRTGVQREPEKLQIEIGRLDVSLPYTDDRFCLRSRIGFVKQLLISPEPVPDFLI